MHVVKEIERVGSLTGHFVNNDKVVIADCGELPFEDGEQVGAAGCSTYSLACSREGARAVHAQPMSHTSQTNDNCCQDNVVEDTETSVPEQSRMVALDYSAAPK